jgi:hypothetical protein
LVIGLRVEDQLTAIRTLMERYANVPMSLADDVWYDRRR